MTVPRNDAARLDVELADPQQPAVDGRRLLRQVDAAANIVGDAFGGGAAHLLSLAIRNPLVHGTFARHGRGCRERKHSGDCAGNEGMLPHRLERVAVIAHDAGLLVKLWAARFMRSGRHVCRGHLQLLTGRARSKRSRASSRTCDQHQRDRIPQPDDGWATPSGLRPTAALAFSDLRHCSTSRVRSVCTAKPRRVRRALGDAHSIAAERSM